MARTKTFDQTEALGEAMGLFWEQGYEATTIRDVSARAGISPSSLYATFGDKHEVYLAALDSYRGAEVEQTRRMLAEPRPVRETLRWMFSELIDSLMADAGQRGSFTLNAAVELGGRDPVVAGRLREHFDDIRALLADRLAVARRDGELAAHHDPADLAHYLLFGLYSLALMVKVYPDRAYLERTAALTLAVLDC